MLFNFTMVVENITAVDMLAMVKTLASKSSRDCYMVMYAARHPFTYKVIVNDHEYNPFFGVDTVADVAKMLERGQLFAEENPDEADNAFYFYCDGVVRLAREGKADTCLKILEDMLKSKAFRKADLVQILDMVIEELSK